jgi:benzoyl-CoA reductase/2-hydroxyglutaryl-CoA dehydratase subunit BcrC/BadD/HgdB
MVEFGLKLEDNKVSEWADKYIDYEKLKDILKKSQAAIKKRDEIIKRKPDLSAEIERAFKEGSKALLSPPMSQISLSSPTPPIIEGIEFNDAVSVADLASGANEKSALVDRGGLPSRYGSESSFHQLLSTVTGIFSKTQYETIVRARLQEVADYHVQFETELFTEVRALSLL